VVVGTMEVWVLPRLVVDAQDAQRYDAERWSTSARGVEASDRDVIGWASRL